MNQIKKQMKTEKCELCSDYDTDTGKCVETGDAMPPDGHCEEFKYIGDKIRTGQAVRNG